MVFTIFHVYLNQTHTIVTGKDDTGNYYVLVFSKIDKTTYHNLSYNNNEKHIVVRYGDLYFNIEIYKNSENFFDNLEIVLLNTFSEVQNLDDFDEKILYLTSVEFNYSLYGINPMVWTIATGMILAYL